MTNTPTINSKLSSARVPIRRSLSGGSSARIALEK